jgi:hypothetical protein
MADVGAIVTDAEVLDWLDVQTLKRNSEQLILEAEAFWLTELDRAFVQDTYTTLHDVYPGQKKILLEDRPVTTFTSLHYVSSRASDGTPTYVAYTADEYVVDEDAGIVKKLSGSFPEGKEEVRSIYTAGFTAAQIAATSHKDVAMLKALIRWYIQRMHMLTNSGGPKMHMRSASAPDGGSTSYQFDFTHIELRFRSQLQRGDIAV